MDPPGTIPHVLAQVQEPVPHPGSAGRRLSGDLACQRGKDHRDREDGRNNQAGKKTKTLTKTRFKVSDGVPGENVETFTQQLLQMWNQVKRCRLVVRRCIAT